MINELNKNMFYLDNLVKYTKYIINNEECQKNNDKSIVLDKSTMLDKSKQNNIFYIPEQDDKLFWCFYILVHEFDKYESIKKASFKIEKDFKIKTIEELRKKKDLLKAYKMKRNLIENELLNEKKITIKSLNLLALLHKINIVYISGRKFLLMNYSETEKIEDTSNIIIQKGKDYQIYSNFSDKPEVITINLSNIIKNYWQIEDINKYIKAISSYTVGELISISNKLEISIMTDANKKKTKKELYNEILIKLNL
jgi:hypothetical protein